MMIQGTGRYVLEFIWGMVAEPGMQFTRVRTESLPYEIQGYGVDDGFRTRDLRIHNPAL